MVGWILLGAAILLALTASSWFWLGVVPLALWRITYFVTYRSRPWRRVHFPLMMLYASAAGAATAQARQRGVEFDVREALVRMASEALELDMSAAAAFVEEQLGRGKSFSDAGLVREELLRRHVQRPEEALGAARSLLAADDNSTKVRLVIAGVVERRCGTAAKGEYLVEVARGKAP